MSSRSTETPERKVVLACPHSDMVTRAARALSDRPLELAVVPTLEQALALARQEPVALVLADLGDSDPAGSDELEALAARIPLVLLALPGQEERAEAYLEHGALDWLAHTAEVFDALAYLVERALRQAAHRAREAAAEVERQALRDALERSRRMELAAQIAGGIAHEFNNLLTAVRGNLHLALGAVPEEHRARPILEDALTATQRASALGKQLLRFTGALPSRAGRVDLNDVVRAARLPDVPAAREVRLQRRPAESPLPVLTEREHLDICVAQLLANALESHDSAPQSAGDSRCISLRSGTLHAEDLAEEAGWFLSGSADSDRFYYLEVSDNGVGIPEDHLERLFEPFFTTKFPGRGMGLAEVYGLVAQAGGLVAVRSEQGGGTTVRLLLPPHDPSSGRDPRGL